MIKDLIHIILQMEKLINDNNMKWIIIHNSQNISGLFSCLECWNWPRLSHKEFGWYHYYAELSEGNRSNRSQNRNLFLMACVSSCHTLL